MAEKKFKRTIFVPSLEGQYKLWKNEIAPACNKADAVYQLGNVVGANDYARDNERNGANEAILKFVLLYRATQESWYQIAGVNEIMALNFPDEWTNATSRQILRNAWFSKNPSMMTATVYEGKLVTHGGLTYGEWLSIGKPDTAVEAARLLNEKYAATLQQGSCYRLGSPPNYAANPIWCDPIMELYPSWVTSPEALPFDQVHGGVSVNTARGREVMDEKNNPLKFVDKVRYNSYGSRVDIGGREILGVDLDLPAKLISSIPQTHQLYIEKLRLPANDGR